MVIAVIAVARCGVIVDKEHKELFEKATKECMADSNAKDSKFEQPSSLLGISV